MNRAWQFNLLLIPAALALGACATTAPRSPLFAKAQQNLQALHANPEVAQWAPDALAEADKAMKEAENASSAKAAHLAFMAEKRVEIAKATAVANREEDEYQTLVNTRNATGGGDDSITTLSQNVVTVHHEVPIQPPPQQATSVPAPSPAQPAPAQATAPAARYVQPGNTAEPAPEPGAQPSAQAAESAEASNSELLTLGKSDFRGNNLTPAGHTAVRGLLTDLVQQPSRTVNISGASRAQLDAVRQALATAGVPEWRLHMRVTATRSVNVEFGDDVSVPTLNR